jgi:gliding motility-associated-like protein
MRSYITTKIALVICLIASSYVQAQMQIDVTPANNLQTFNTCNGFIIDSGGQGGPGYSNNETTIITICPDVAGQVISVIFNLFQLDLTDDNPSPTAVNVDVMNVYDGTSTAANTLGSYTGNQLQGVVISATILNPTGCLTFEFISNTVGTGAFSGSATCQTPCSDPQAGGAIVGGITSDSIRVCLGELVDFVDQGSFAQAGFTLVSYDWDFMDGLTASGTNVSHAYTVPGEYRVQLFVTDDNGCSNPNLVDLTVLVGTLPDFSTFPSDTALCPGEDLLLIADPNSYEVPWTGFNGAQSISDGCLPDDLLGVAQDINLLQTGFSAGSVITSVNDIQSICFDIEHSFMGDLVIIIECPNGQSAMLHQQGGGGTQLGIPNPLDNVDCTDPATQGVPFTYCFDANATETWVDWVNNNPGAGTLPAGVYQPIDPLSNLNGCPTNGVWTLTVVDNWAADDGTLFSFALNLDPSFYPAISTFEPQIGLASDSSYWVTPAPFQTSISADANQLGISPTTAGTYNYQYIVIDNFGCQHDTTICGTNLIQLLGEISGPGAVSSCDYILTLDDTFGDGWNGNTITVTINGVSTDYALTAGLTQSFNIAMLSGAAVVITFNANGAFVDECFYSLVDAGGANVFTQGPNLPGVTNNNVTPACPPDFVFDWTAPGSLNNPTIIDPTMNVTATETLTFSVYPTGHPMCIETDDITITLAPVPDAGVDASASYCSSGVPVDLFPLLGPTAGPGGTWEDAAGNIVAMPYDPSTMTPGLYTYIVNLNGCLDSSVVDVAEVVTEITVISGTDISCNGFDDGIIDFTGVNYVLYTINAGGPVVANADVSITGLAPGVYTIQITSNDGCIDTEVIEILEPTALAITIDATDALCNGVCDGLAQVNITGGTIPYTYLWLQGVNGNQSGAAIDLCAGDYGMNVMDDNGCLISTSYTIEEPALVLPSLLPDATAGCFPHHVNFINTTGSPDVVTTEIDYGDGNVDVIAGLGAFDHTFSQPGLYTVTISVTTITGCVYSLVYSDLIEAVNAPNANFFVNPNYVSMMNPIVNLFNESSADVTQYSWVIDEGSPSTANTENVFDVSYPEDNPRDYEVILYVENSYGCKDSIVKYVHVVNDVLLFAPNTFTPDDDEHNQNWEFHISGIDIYDFTLRLYNRWGEQVWESHDASVGWDGTYNGKLVQDGTYTWMIDCGDAQDDQRYTFNGHVTVIR